MTTANKHFVRSDTLEDSAPALASVTPFPRATDAVADAGSGAQVASSPSRGWPIKALIAGLLAAIIGVIVWVVMRDPAAPTAAAATANTQPLELASVDVATVGLQTLSRSLPLSGSMSPIVQATVKSKVGGEVELVPLREGQDVREGEVIARIDTRNLQAQYDRQLAAVDRARADLDLATLNRDKNRVLLDKHYISQNTYEATESAYAGMVASLKLAEADARLAKISLEDAVVRAPFAGTIAKRHVQPGEKVSMDSTIVTLVDLRQMVLEAAVPAADIPAVQIGQPAKFKVGGFGAREFVGEVQRINPITADGSRAITIYIAVSNPNRALKGGMFAQGALTLDTSEPVLAVPQRAVHEEAGAAYVYTLRDDKIARTNVKVGAAAPGGTFVEVREGLAAGDRVIVTEITSAQVGQKVLVRADQAAAAPASALTANR
ncbi:MAG TPA: efflux RND transporter periplasmic adaptor subunit [Steroidobacteraceae bacterium]|nr:efflux RND transporter periplasmic adaptor subunit [Steroidobacteraceae bacterium]